MNSWWVNQGQSYAQERHGGYLWAPLETNGRHMSHWDAMTEVGTGDLVLHYAAKQVRAISIVTTVALEALRPAELPEGWGSDGRQVRCNYSDARRSVQLDEIPLDWRLAETRGPFRRDGAVKFGYLFPLSAEFATRFLGAFGDRFPSPQPLLLPAEAREEATDLLRRLIGVNIATVDGRPNRVLGLEPPDVIVATSRSPLGQRVPIADVQHALDELRSTGSVTVHPEAIGYRSAFVGAVLLTLPGARSSGSPPVITIDLDPTADGATDQRTITFEGDLDRPRDTAERGEQALLRRILFGAASHARCAMCGQTYPVQFLRAAHIKPRRDCSDEERRDLRNVVMPACLFGCDSLYEYGYLGVNARGEIEVSAQAADDPSLRPRVEALPGRRSHLATAGRSRYFAWHRKNVFRE